MKLKSLFAAKTFSNSCAGAGPQASVFHFIILVLLYTSIVCTPVPGIAAEGYLPFGNPWQGLKRWRDKPSPYSALWFGMDLFEGKAFYEDYMVGQWVDLGYGSTGDTITWRMISPGGNIQDSTLHWIDSGGYWMQMRNFQVIEWGPGWTVADGVFSPVEIGPWRFELLHNDKVVHTDQFELIPRTLVKNSDASPTVIVSEDGTYNHIVLSVKLLDFDGVSPKGGEVVSFSVTPPKGSKGGGVNPSAMSTDADGIASVNFVPGSKSGKYVVEASTPSAATTSQTFIVTVSQGQEDPPDPDNELIDDKNQGEPIDAVEGETGNPIEELEVAGGICPQVGNPINIGNGNKYQKEKDFVTRSIFPLSFVRHYNSLADENTSMGAHWRNNYHRSITKLKDGKGKKASWVAEVNRHNGKTYRFNQSADGRWLGDPDVSDHLEEISSGWRYTTRHGVVEIYDESGRLSKIVNRNGHEHYLHYDAAGRLQQIQDGFGKSTLVGYSADGLIQTVTDPAGGVYEYAYDAAGNLSQVTYPDTNTRRYLYEDSAYPHALTGIIDENGQRYATWAYDDAGRAIHSEHAAGNDAVDISFQANGTRTVTDTAGSVSTYQVVALHGAARVAQLHREKCADCGIAFAKQTSYDSNGYPKFGTDGEGNQTAYYYNERGLLESKIKAFGSTQEQRTSIVWHSRFNLPLAVRKEASSTYYNYDQSGKLLEKRQTDNVTGATRVWTYNYNDLGLLVAADGPRSDVDDVITYTYHPDGNLASIANPVYTEITYLSYDAFGRPLEQLDANGVLTRLEYDLRGRLISSETDGEITLLQYDDAGNITGVTGPDGRQINYRYDEAGRLVEQEDGAGNLTRYTLDGKGERIEEVTGSAFQSTESTHRWRYDPLGFLVEDQGAKGQTTSFAYDSRGNRISRTDVNSGITRFAYDALNRLDTVTHPDGGVVTHAYDDAGNLVRVTDPLGNSTRYSYNGFGEQVEVQSPDAGTTQTVYDKAGNISSKSHEDGASVSNQYDVLNRLLQSSYSDGSVINYTYDGCQNGIGRLCSVSTGDTRLSWNYDGHGRVTEKIQQVDSVELAASTVYDAQGQMVSMTYPSGRTLSYEYSEGQLTGLTLDGSPVLSNVAYNAMEQVSGWIWGNGAQHARAYDQDGWLTQHSIGHLERTLSYDLLGNVSAMVDAENARQFGYDEMQRLIYAVSDSFNLDLAYDANGNRLTLTEDAETATYSYEALSNRLAQVTGIQTKRHQYDARGNILGDGVHVFGYDARNRLVNVDDGAVTYTYDALGQRVAKKHNATASYFVYGENGNLIGEYDQDGNALRETLYLHGMPVAVVNPEGLYNIHLDHLNTPRYITDQANTLVWKWASDPFGDTPVDDDPDGDGQSFTYNIRFLGQYYDQETGLHYNYFRDYDPSTGRYIESDPIGLDGGLNTYAYANSNPLIFIDPKGLVRIHGNWCGPDWTGGLVEQYQNSSVGHYLFPRTLMDNACRAHDICYSVCRAEYKCNKVARGECMTQCDRSLANATPIGSNSGTSLAKSMAIYIWMNYNIFPYPGENSPECSCSE